MTRTIMPPASTKPATRRLALTLREARNKPLILG